MSELSISNKLLKILINCFKSPACDVRYGNLKDLEIISLLRKVVNSQLTFEVDLLSKNKNICFCFPSPPLIYPDSKEDALSLWQQGATLSIQGLENRSKFISNICNSLRKEFGFECTCSLYASKINALGFSFHTDEWLGLAIQIKGKKKFIFKEVNNFDSLILTEGDWLRIDPNELHKAETISMSIHLNFAIHTKYKKQ